MRLAIIGRLLPTRVMMAMRGTSISTTATRTTTISPIALMSVVLEQESKECLMGVDHHVCMSGFDV